MIPYPLGKSPMNLMCHYLGPKAYPSQGKLPKTKSAIPIRSLDLPAKGCLLRINIAFAQVFKTAFQIRVCFME